ncbi:MAG: DUF2971 domain-containing protein [Candidatus Enteromonas sp.]|nr:DUF2971 domain-containing protein [Candidatus Enteromonas sp.]
MCNERIDNCDNLLIVDSRYIDYFFYLLYCFYNEKCDEKSYISLESFNKNKSKIKVDFSSINLLFELSNSIDYSKLNEFKSFVKKQSSHILFSKKLTLYKYRDKFEMDKLDLKFTDIRDLNDPLEGDCYFKNSNQEFYPYILSLCTKKDDLLMWSYYGGGHRGMCLTYESEDINQNLSRFISKTGVSSGIIFTGYKNISYRSKSIGISANEADRIGNLYELIKKCFSKNIRFQHENEFRYLMIGRNDQQGSFVKCLPTEIELGCKNFAIGLEISKCNIGSLK